MAIVRVRFQQPRSNKRLADDEPIYTTRIPFIDKEDKNVLIHCAFCPAPLLMSSIKASALDPKHLQHMFCSPFCKLKFLIKDRDPSKCWVFSRPGFIWEQRMFSFRSLCYQLHFNEVPPPSNRLRSICRKKLCANPLHVEKAIRVISLDL